jgi:hypothetical protein
MTAHTAARSEIRIRKAMCVGGDADRFQPLRHRAYTST